MSESCPNFPVHHSQPGPPFAPNAATIHPTTGVYTWDTNGARLNPNGETLYSTQVTIEDLDGSGNVVSKSAIDFFIRLVQAPEVVTDTVKIPLRWCGIEGAPSMDDPGLVGARSTQDIFLRRQRRVSENIYLPQANISFRSAATEALPGFPIIHDTDAITTPDGNILDPAFDGGAEWVRTINKCRNQWQGTAPQVTGITAVQINRFVDRAGNPTGLLGIGGSTNHSNTPSQLLSGSVTAVETPTIGTWVWISCDRTGRVCSVVDGNQPEDFLDDLAHLKEVGFTRIYLKGSDGSIVNQFLGTIGEGARSENFEVYTWHFVYGDDVEGEAAAILQSAVEAGASGIVINAESAFYGKSNQASQLVQLVRQGWGGPLYFSSFGFPRLHLTFPWEEFWNGTDGHMPQIFPSCPGQTWQAPQLLQRVLDDHIERGLTGRQILPLVEVRNGGCPSLTKEGWEEILNEVNGVLGEIRDNSGLPHISVFRWDIVGPGGEKAIEEFLDKPLGHQLGHALSLRHGNGIDDDGDGELDEPGEEANPTDGSNLMQYKPGVTITEAQSDQIRAQALLHIPDREVDPVLPPLANSAVDEVGDVPPGNEYADIDTIGVAVDQQDETTVFVLSTAGLLPDYDGLGNSDSFLT